MTSEVLPNYIANVLLNRVNSTNNLADAIITAECLGSLLWMNNIGVYSLAATERELTRRLFCHYGEKCASHMPHQGGVTFVVTEPYLAGGHTRLMERLASMLDNECDLLVSGNAEINVLEKISPFFREVTLSDSEMVIHDKIFTIAQKISRYDYVVLNTHPDDIVSVLACALAKKINKDLKVLFVNHADHVFSFGCSVVDIWFEISVYGEKISQSSRGLTCATSFLGIPLDDGKEYNRIQFSAPKRTDVKTIVTSGSGWKFKKRKGSSIFPYFGDVLTKYPGATIVVVGVNVITDYWWWFFALRNFGRIKFFKILPYEKFMLLTKEADIYMDSYPIPGGTAFVEQALSGVYCCGLKSPIQGYTPLEMMKNDKWMRVDDSVNGELIRNSIIEVHSFDEVRKRFLGCLFDGGLYVNPMNRYLEWSGDLSFFVNKKVNRYPKNLLHYLTKNPTLLLLTLFRSPIITTKSFAIEFARHLLR